MTGPFALLAPLPALAPTLLVTEFSKDLQTRMRWMSLSSLVATGGMALVVAPVFAGRSRP